MEVVYLLFSIISIFLKSLLLSLLLPFRLLFFRRRSAVAADSVSLYEGTVWHERRRPVHHSLRYRVRYALVDLDDGPCGSVSDHLSADEARRIAATDGPVLLLTIPESVGYAQNPLSVYYCYDVEGSDRRLSKCIAEVTNTPWGERVIFSFDPKSDLAAKPLHVSPFMDMLGNWSIKANDPSDDLFVGISVQHPTLGDYFTATLKAKRVPSSTVYDHSLFFWLMPHKVAVWIYWHAIKLWWKNVAFIQHPRYTHPDYREEAVNRDRKLRCCGFSGFDQTRVGDSSTKGKHEARWLTWRDAKWPWS